MTGMMIMIASILNFGAVKFGIAKIGAAATAEKSTIPHATAATYPAIVGRDLLKEPGLHRSIFGDNFSTMVSGLIGSVPTTTYGENIGVMAVRAWFLFLP